MKTNEQIIEFTKEEIKVLKEIAREQILIKEIIEYDDKGNKIPYRNRYGLEKPNILEEKEAQSKRDAKEPKI